MRYLLLIPIIIIFMLGIALVALLMEYSLAVLGSVPQGVRSFAKLIFTFVLLGLIIAFMVSLIVLILEARVTSAETMKFYL